MRFMALLVLTAGAIACSTTSQTPIVSVEDPRAGSLSTLTRAEIVSRYGRGNLLDALRELRPLHLAPRGTDELAVFVDDVQLTGGLAALSGVPADQVTSVRFLYPAAARFRFGPEAAGGAILVRLWNRRGTVHVR
jgi:hypothetical protein